MPRLRGHDGEIGAGTSEIRRWLIDREGEFAIVSGSGIERGRPRADPG
jgi:hypothetical protein